ncbi:MAG TPA: bifunctional riboflavin kinase/FAD synthetase [Stellaceae bacterium]|nr:bifunctional riboflavin kinase/FAD synthetase [Stellaceae bacterium]
MRVLRHSNAAPGDRGAVVALGNFDGVHRGHQAVIARAGEIARQASAPHAVLTFEPHPYGVFKPDAAPFRLTPFRAKARHIEPLGVDLLFALHFNLAFAQKSAESFIDEVLVAGLGVRHIVVGYDFVFGQGRRGNAKTLLEAAPAKGFRVTVVEPIKGAGDALYSSTRIREHLAAGRPRDAAALLGRLWEIDGRVEHGERVGHGLGFPTANLDLADYLRPALGIYAVFAGIEGKSGTEWHKAAAYLGRRPTLGDHELRLETHLIDFQGDLYGRHLRVAFTDHLRGDRIFPGLDALRTQIGVDVAAARHALAGARSPAP